MEEKTYTYDPKRYRVEVLVTGWFCVFIFVVCILLAIGGFLPIVMFACAIVALYTVWNTFAAHAYPNVVTLSDKAISFTSLGRTDAYDIADITQISVKEFPYSDKSYVRINGGGLTSGRYWVNGQWMNDGHELFEKLTELDLKINPEGLKAHSRRG